MPETQPPNYPTESVFPFTELTSPVEMKATGSRVGDKLASQKIGSSLDVELDTMLFSDSVWEDFPGGESAGECASHQSEDNGANGCEDGIPGPRPMEDHRLMKDGRLLEYGKVTNSEGGFGEEEDELLCGLYPEDVSFFLNSSAVLLPQDIETGIGTSIVGGGQKDGPWDHPTEAMLEDCTIAGSTPHLPLAGASMVPQLPQPYSSPPAAASSPLQNRLNPCPPRTVNSDRIDYPANTFYGLPLLVQRCLAEHRGISKLYGKHAKSCLWKPAVHITLSC